jgi:hypothetical protein
LRRAQAKAEQLAVVIPAREIPARRAKPPNTARRSGAL